LVVAQVLVIVSATTAHRREEEAAQTMTKAVAHKPCLVVWAIDPARGN
jgi:hypothetical protein